jgi:hypothetical protein
VTEGVDQQGRQVGGMTPRASRPSPTLRRRWLVLAQAAWVVVAVVSLGAFVAGVPAHHDYLAHPTAGVRDALAELGLSPGGYAFYNVALDTVFVSIFALVAAVIFWRRSDDLMALLVATMLVSWGTLNELFVVSPEAIVGMSPIVDAVLTLLTYTGYITWMLFFYLFPSGSFVPRWTRWLGLLYGVAFFGLWNFTPFGPESWPPLLFGTAVVSVWGSFLGAQVYRYARVSDTTQRQQTKWVVFGVAAALAGALTTIFTVGAAIDLPPEEVGPRMLSLLLMDAFGVLIPLSVGIAVLRSRLYDIDIVINRTLVYGSLSVMLGLVYLGGVATTQAIFRALTGQEQQPQLGIVISTLLIAALFNPLRQRIQSFIDRRFYRSKYDAIKTLETFSVKLRDETDLSALSDDLVGVVRETMQPAHVSLWLRPDKTSKGRLTD